MAQSYSNSGGSGKRIYLILVKSTGISWGGGGLRYIVDTLSNTSWFNSGSNSGRSITFDFGTAKIIDEAKWYQDLTTSQGVWQWEGSNDDSSYTSIGSTFTLGGATTQTQTVLNGNTTPYRYYRLTGVSGSSSSSPFQRGVEFSIDDLNTSVTDYGNTYGAGDRTASMTISQSQSAGHGDLLVGRANANDPLLELFVDNLNRVDVSGTGALIFKTSSGAGASGKWVRYQFPSSVVVDEVRWFQDTTDTHGVWQFQGSNDGSSWTNVGSSDTLGGGFDSAYGYSKFTAPNGNTTGYTYYRFLGASGNVSGTPFVFEVAFRIKAGAPPPSGGLFRASALSGVGTGGRLFSNPLQ